ncbi:DNA-binding protein Ewg-like [Chrysoperla carnea]|uniref:DNA-binding protein Ewg-like n=1 Tax=Chrysoperla carnea TaxID=189513 RepID=UPI001D073330|nr:DNA-binding protein Ewg-like [Chrysoperla carnea]
MATILKTSVGAMVVGNQGSPGGGGSAGSGTNGSADSIGVGVSVLSGASEEDDNECPSSPAGVNDDGSDLMAAAMGDEVTAQLAAAGPVGIAAAAAIASAKKRKRPNKFEINPAIRKRHQNRLLRKLREIIDEFTTRVGQQAVVLVATPGKPNTSYKVFGAKPLEDVVKNLRPMIMEELENLLAQQAPPPVAEDPFLFELPPLIFDGFPTPVEKMTQAQLRAFIPLMVKYSTGRGKPGWGLESTRPPWWPKELPWASVRIDARTEDEKQKISYSNALRQIVINCYKYHGREDLLPAFSEEDERANSAATANANMGGNTYSVVLQTITNPDGSISILQVDSNNPIITLPDGTTAQVQGLATIPHGDETTVHTLNKVGDGTEIVDLNTVTEATLNQDGQLILTSEKSHGTHGYPILVNGGVITEPVSASIYQTMVANIQQIHTNSDGTVCVTPMVQIPMVGMMNDDTVVKVENMESDMN